VCVVFIGDLVTVTKYKILKLETFTFL